MKRHLFRLGAVIVLMSVALAGLAQPSIVEARGRCSIQGAGSNSIIFFTVPVNVGGGDSINVGATSNLTLVGISIKLPDGTTNTGYTGVRAMASSGGTATVTFVPANGSVSYSYVIVVCSGGGDSDTGGYFGPLYYDGRLNDKDGQETAAIYCLPDGSVRVYVMGTPNWTIDFDASRAEIASVPKNPSHNMLIKRGHFAMVSRLSGGLLQVNSPGLNPADGDYTFTFQDCLVAH